MAAGRLVIQQVAAAQVGFIAQAQKGRAMNGPFGLKLRFRVGERGLRAVISCGSHRLDGFGLEQGGATLPAELIIERVFSSAMWTKGGYHSAATSQRRGGAPIIYH